MTLNLRAVEANLRVLDSDPNGVLTLADERALLAHCRALRAALKECRVILANANLANRVLWLDAVLAQATDEETKQW